MIHRTLLMSLSAWLLLTSAADLVEQEGVTSELLWKRAIKAHETAFTSAIGTQHPMEIFTVKIGIAEWIFCGSEDAISKEYKRRHKKPMKKVGGKMWLSRTSKNVTAAEIYVVFKRLPTGNIIMRALDHETHHLLDWQGKLSGIKIGNPDEMLKYKYWRKE